MGAREASSVLQSYHPYKNDVGAQKLGLAALGVHAFVAHEDIEPSHEWQEVIEEALATCDALAAWLTPDFSRSSWTDQEVGFCVGRQVPVVPIRVGVNPYGFIGKYQGLQGEHKDPIEISKEIAEALAGNGVTAPTYIEPAARAFSAAGSYEMARVTYRLLTFLPRRGWTVDSLDLVEQAPAMNDQIERCVYERQPLPDLLREFVAERRAGASPRPPGSPLGAPLIECRSAVDHLDDVFERDGRVFRDNWTAWLHVKNNGPTTEFSTRLWNVQGLPRSWGPSFGVRQVAWEGRAGTTRPEIDGHGGELRVKVANLALDPTHSGSTQPRAELRNREHRC